MKYNIKRSITIHAPLEKVRSHIDDFKKWSAWSPWSILEPDHESTFEGKAGEKGHKMSWSGKTIGSGAMTIATVKANTIDYDLEFFKPFKSKSKTSFILEKEGEKNTKVIWTMESSLPFFLFFMVNIMKSWIEMDYDRGLTMLKEVVEKGKVHAKSSNDGVVDFKGFSYVGLKKTSHVDEMPKEMSACFGKLMTDLKKHDAKADKWISLYAKVDMKNKLFTYIAAVSNEDLKGKSLGEDYVSGKIESGRMLKITHKGSYRFLGNAWSMGNMYLQANKKKMKKKGYPFEFYVNNPHETKEEDLITEIYFPLR